MKPYELSLSQALTRMASKELSSEELTQSYLDRIETVEPQVSAFIEVHKENALRQAREADQKRQAGDAGRLCGIPLSLKDLICQKGMKMTCGSRILENFVSPYDATVVEKIRQADAVILGKVAMDEFAMGSTSETCFFTTPINPHKKGYVSGGSSGGSAVSVASLECAASLGSDTGGSIRQPASLCGVVGMKPTYGRVSRFGLTAFASSLDQIGPICHDVEDCARMLEVISGYDPRDSTSVNRPVPRYSEAIQSGLEGMTLGVPREYFTEGLDDEVRKIVEAVIALLKEMGVKVVDVSLPHTEYCVAVYYLIASSEASSNLARYDGVLYGYRTESPENLMDMYTKTRSEGFGEEVKRRILIGTYALSSGYYDAYYKKASQVRTLILNDFQKVFADCDILISPVTPHAAWKLGQFQDDPLAAYVSDILTISANLAGIPGMSVPGGFTGDGLPVGVQLQAAHFQEEKLLRVGYNLEQALCLKRAVLDI
ncbi:MAG: Asp-tRNA(Asn)/Glu-tRNA(Gln) amidotransferase GatCAB subunit A [Deltaproteobacteria bacterium]|nr:MAG: Asp-tRNA(Asn)/Glu-tRNA(Gln) amidotransferase GatCAB subunit A [Deltaproteobacteria bacterium]